MSVVHSFGLKADETLEKWYAFVEAPCVSARGLKSGWVDNFV